MTMNRRTFTRTAFALTLAPASAAAQGTPTSPYDALSLANAYAQAYLGVTRETEVANLGRQIANALLRSALAGLRKQIAQANQAGGEFSRLANQSKGPLLDAAKKKGLPEFDIVVSSTDDRLAAELNKLAAADQFLVLSRRQVDCVMSCVRDMAVCVSPLLLSSVISCGLQAMPALRGGTTMFLSVFGGCLLLEVPDLTGDAVAGCFATLRKCAGKCNA